MCSVNASQHSDNGREVTKRPNNQAQRPALGGKDKRE